MGLSVNEGKNGDGKYMVMGTGVSLEKKRQGLENLRCPLWVGKKIVINRCSS